METITTKTEDIKIAGELMMKHWKALKLNSDKNENWDKAFNFFEKRITTRYLNPIHEILNMDLNTGEGFAVVNLQCSLIETIESFQEGWIFHKNKYYHRIIKSVKDCLKKGNLLKAVFQLFQIHSIVMSGAVYCTKLRLKMNG